MSKAAREYEQLAMALGLRFDAERMVIYGQREGFSLIVAPEKSGYPYQLTVSVGARSPRGTLERDEIKQFVKEDDTAVSITYDANRVKMFCKNIKNQEKLRAGLNSAISHFISFLKSKGYEPCCQFCGQQQVETAEYNVSGEYMHLCPDCAGKLRQDLTLTTQKKEQKSENMVGGIVGALLGSVIGAVCIIFFSQLGKIAVISGFVMAICTLKGYELLSGKLTKKGFIIGSIMMLVMTYLGDRMDWAIIIARELETDIFTGFQSVPLLLEAEMIESGDYWYNLIMLYLFTVAGAASVMYSMIKDRKKEGKFGQLGSPDVY